MYENKEEIEKVILFAVDLDNGEQEIGRASCRERV